MFCFEQRMTRPASFAITSLQTISSSTSNEQWRAELQRRPTRGSVSLHTFKSVKAGLKPVRKILAARSKIATSESLRRGISCRSEERRLGEGERDEGWGS